MVQRKRTYRKKTYKRKTYKRRYYKRRYYKRRYKPLKKPEIHIVEDTINEFHFNDATYGVGTFNNLARVSGNPTGVLDQLEYKLNTKPIDGSKVRLKYLYIKGFIKVSGTNEDDFNCKLMVFRWKRNTLNNSLSWSDLINNTNSITNLSDPSTWTETDRLRLLYMQDWKNDIKINFYKKVKNLYRKYDDANNIIPFKIRINLYDCVLTCDNSKASNNQYTPNINPSTNGLYFTFLSNQFNETNIISYKWKLYYTDY